MKKIIIALFLIFLSFILALAIKGNYGNPTPQEIKQNLETVGQPFELSPERGRYALTMSLAQDHSFSLSKDIARFVTPDLGYFGGRYYLLVSPAVSMLGVPFYLIGANFNLAQVATFTMPAVFAILCALLILKICEQLKISFRASLVAATTYLLATPAFAYSVSLYQHQITAFLLLATASLVFAGRKVWTLTLAAFLVGFAFWVDSQNPIFFIPLVGFAIASVFDISTGDNRISISTNIKYLIAIIGLLVALGGYSLYSRASFNKPFKLSGTLTSIKDFDQNGQPIIKTLSSKKNTSRFFNPRRIVSNFATLVVNDDRGVIYYAPVMLVGILGIGYLYRRKSRETVAILGSIFFIFVLYTMWGDPWGGWAFGPRYLVPLFALMAVFIASSFDSLGRRIIYKVGFSLLFLYSAGVNLLGAMTTNQVPPKVEGVALKIKWNYFLNWDMFARGDTSSFIYKTYLAPIVPLHAFVYFMFLLIALVGLALVWTPKGAVDAEIKR